ncbi:hypothetical protein ACFLYP_03100 [Chloroflexota bacterium]
MEDLFLVIVVVIIFCFLISIPVWILLKFNRKLKTSAQSDRKIKARLMIFTVILGFGAYFIIDTYVRSLSSVIFYEISRPPPGFSYSAPDYFDEAQRDRIIRELWLQTMIFPPLERRCYSESEICEWTAEFIEYDPLPSRSEYLCFRLKNLLAVLPSTFFIWLYTRKPRSKNGDKNISRSEP